MTPKDFYTLVSEMVTSAQARASVVIDATVGSIVRAILESTGALSLWLQGLIFQLLQKIRAATATGADLDSWVADFGVVTRNAAVGSGGLVTFARFTTGQSATVPFGAIVQTADGSQKYAVVADSGNAYYTSGGYVLGPSTASAQLPVLAQTAGSAGNVGAGLVNLLAQAIPYIDTVSNAAAMTGGADGESDASLRARFIVAINNQSKGTKAAIAAAIQAYNSALTFQLVENYDSAGAPRPGYFYAYIDDGTGATPSGTLTAVSSAIEQVRAFTVGFAVVAASPVTATVAMTIVVAANFSSSAVTSAVQTAIQAYINGLGVGVPLYFAQLGVVAGNVSGVQSVTAVSLNSGTSNLSVAANQVARAGTVTITT